MNRQRVTAALLVLVWFAYAVEPPDGAADATTSGPVHDYRSLVAHLRESGLRVEAAGKVEQRFFTPKAKVLRFGDSGKAQVYEYATEEQAAAEAARVNFNDSIGTSMPMWIAPPHFFRKRWLIVPYLGSDKNTLLTLPRMMRRVT